MKTNALVHILAAGFCSCSLQACQEGAASVPQPASASTPHAAPVSIDGLFGDWAGDSVMRADAHYLYFRFTILDHEWTLQASDTPVALMIDTDDSSATGRVFNLQDINTLGVDLVIQFAPASKERRGVMAYALDAAGTRTPVPTDDLDVIFAPTYASQWYEMRIARGAANLTALPQGGMRSRGQTASFACTLTGDDAPKDYSDPVRVVCPEASATPKLSDARLPACPEGGVRVVSWNVLRSGPDSDAKREQFKRIIQALNPDIMLLQEWEAPNAEHVQSWFTAVANPNESWTALSSGSDIAKGGGCVVVSRHPVLPAAGAIAADSKPVRFIAARIKTPAGDFLAGSAHLKSRGSKDSPEDRRRLAEAGAINTVLRSLLDSAEAPVFRVLAGDLNLVGTRPPLDVLRGALDTDGTAMEISDAYVLGDTTITTWREDANAFTPGRLDYMVFSDASLSTANAFVLDTRRLSDAALARIGLDRADSAASDHMPVVVDLLPRR